RGTPCHFPKMAIGILEDTGVAPHQGVMGGFEDLASCLGSLLQCFIHHRFVGYTVAEHEFGHGRSLQVHSRFMRKTFPWPERERQAGLQIKEGRSSVVDIGAYDPLCSPTQAISVKAYGFLKIRYAERDDGKLRFHGVILM